MDSVKLIGTGALALVLACDWSPPPPQPTGTSPSNAIEILVEQARGNGEIVQVKVRVELAGHAAVFSDGDELVFHDSSGHVRALEDNGLPSGGEYEAEIATTQTALALDFVRTSGLARTIPIDLPPPFTLVAPLGVARGAGIDVTWAADTAFGMSVSASGSPCLPPGGWSRTFAVDPGFVTLQGADFSPSAQPCALTFVATRSDASATMSQVRTIFFDTTP